MHVRSKDQKNASQMVKMAHDAELELDEDLQHEVHAKLGAKAQKLTEDGSLLAGSRLTQFADEGTIHRKRANPVEQRHKDLRANYDKEIQRQKMRRISNSSFLTPAAATYLNEVVRENRTKVDDELLYAGLHDTKASKMQFKRNEKFTSKYTKRRQSKRRKKGRFG